MLAESRAENHIATDSFEGFLLTEGQVTIMVVDDDRVQCALLRRWLEQAGWSVDVQPDGEHCLAALESQAPAAICLDLHLPGLSGLETLTRIISGHPDIPVVMLTGDEGVGNAVEALKAGAYDYLTKSSNRKKLLATLANAVEHGHMTLQLRRMEQQHDSSPAHRGMIGESSQIRNVFREMDAVAMSNVTVLINGESGTGKELVAAGLHAASGRATRPFVAVNCAAIPESLQESELFGHERGSFTGASTTRQGLFERANGGTLFLDEVGDLSLTAQAKLLRVLETRTFHRVGGHREHTSDFRLIAATHRDLKADVDSGRFREDLYYRLAVFELRIPPLRDRGADCLLLASEFAARHGERLRGRRALLDNKALELVRAYHWPGNVRELDNAIQRAVVACRGGIIRPADFPEFIQRALLRGQDLAGDDVVSITASTPSLDWKRSQPVSSRTGTLDDIEREAIRSALESTGYNRAAASRLLGIGRTTLYAKMKKYGFGETAASLAATAERRSRLPEN